MRSVEATPSIPSIVPIVGALDADPSDLEQCDKCRFWDEVERNAQRAIGECRRRAPTLHPPVAGVEMPIDATFFPETDNLNWCGEFEVRK